MKFELKWTCSWAIAMLHVYVDLLSTLNGMSSGTRYQVTKKGSLSVASQQVDGGMPQANPNYLCI